MASLAALRWAVREAGLRESALQVVRAWEDTAKRVAPYASHTGRPAGAEDHHRVAGRLQADVAGALGPSPLVLGSARCAPDGIGPVARACLRHAPCPVVVVSDAMTDLPVLA